MCVFEYQKMASGLVLADAQGNVKATKRENCWNLLYDVEFDPSSQEETDIAFLACHTWIEQNKVPTSKYVIHNMFFYAPK